MKIRFLEETHIRSAPRFQDATRIGSIFTGSEIEVEPTLAFGDEVEGNNRWYTDKNGWFYWSGRVDIVELVTFPAVPRAIQTIFPVFKHTPDLSDKTKIPEGESRALPSAESNTATVSTSHPRALITEQPAEVIQSRGIEEISILELDMNPDPIPTPPVKIVTEPALISTPQIEIRPSSMPTSNPITTHPIVIEPVAPSPESHGQLNWALERHQIEKDWWNSQDLKGQNIKIAILSTGVLPQHPDLTRVTQQFLYPGTEAPEHDVHGFGTQAAVICAGNGKMVFGVAPEAQLLIAKIGTQNHTINPEAFLAGLEWALSAGVDVVAMLIDFAAFAKPQEEKIQTLIQKACKSGILLLAPVGNTESKKPENRYPAAYDGVFSVGAHDELDRRCNFSARSYHLDVLAPGEELLTMGLDGLTKNVHNVSMATAFTAGFMALVCQYLRQNGHQSGPDEVFPLLRETAKAHRAFNAGSDTEYGYGVLNPSAVLEHLLLI